MQEVWSADIQNRTNGDASTIDWGILYALILKHHCLIEIFWKGSLGFLIVKYDVKR